MRLEGNIERVCNEDPLRTAMGLATYVRREQNTFVQHSRRSRLFAFIRISDERCVFQTFTDVHDVHAFMMNLATKYGKQ